MTEYMLFRMAMAGAAIGMFALTATAWNRARAACRRFYQRKESRIGWIA